jgi:hypothetical protein
MPAAKKAAAPAKKGDGFRVVAPLVQASLDSGTPMQFREGDILPDGISKESLEHLQSLGYVTKGDAPAESDDE